MYIETHRDIYPLCQGTQKGNPQFITEEGGFLPLEEGGYLLPEGLGDVVIINDPGADFRSCGVQVGSAVRNITDGSSGLVTAVTEDTVTCTLSGGAHNMFYYGETYAIYCTSEYNSKISMMYTDKRFGHKVTDKKELVDGLFPEDVDLDEYRSNVFGPGQPKKEYM